MKNKITLALFGVLLSMQISAQESECAYLCNPEFEDTYVPIPTVSLLDNTQMTCWNTTASDGLMEIWGSGYGGVPAYGGSQFLEINATQSSTVYQDFTVAPGTILAISFAHRGRAGMDSVKVEAGPVGGPYTDLGHFGDGTSGWGYYTVPYTVPPSMGSSYSVRFTSIYWSGGNVAIGNFLDAVSVCRTGTVPVECDVCKDTGVKLVDFKLINAAGYATATFHLNSGGRVINKMRITLLNYRVTPSDEKCKDYCKMTNEDFGHIIDVPEPIVDYPYTMSPYNPAISPAYTNDIELVAASTPRVINDFISLRLKFPPILSGRDCDQVVEACFRVEFIDKDCIVCDRVVCVTTGDPKDPKNPDDDGTKGRGNPGNTEGSLLQVYPNPNNGNFMINTSAIGEGCRYQLTTPEGKEVQSGPINQKLLELNNTGLPQGTYTLFVFKENRVFVEKIVVVKNN